MNSRIKIAESYEEKWLEVERPQPLIDNWLESLTKNVVTKSITKDTSDQVYADFQNKFTNWILDSKLNRLSGLNSFPRTDIIIGCTQLIDNLYMQGPVQVLSGDYKYHERLNLAKFSIVGKLENNLPMIISLPFPKVGSIHDQMDNILNEAEEKNIDVHIDGAWISSSRNINFDFSHPAIKSVGMSCSKGLGLGWNRIGLRWSKLSKPDSISIMNDFHMNNRALAIIGLYFLQNVSPDYLWKTHGDNYKKLCKHFNLTETDTIHIAIKQGRPVGVSPLLRYMENAY
jgi:hypothetical protein